jgi:hypothetical protein
MRHALVLCSAPSRGGRRGAGDGAPAPQPAKSPSAPAGTTRRDGHDAAADGTDGAAPRRKAGVGCGMSRVRSTAQRPSRALLPPLPEFGCLLAAIVCHHTSSWPSRSCCRGSHNAKFT